MPFANITHWTFITTLLGQHCDHPLVLSLWGLPQNARFIPTSEHSLIVSPTWKSLLLLFNLVLLSFQAHLEPCPFSEVNIYHSRPALPNRTFYKIKILILHCPIWWPLATCRYLKLNQLKLNWKFSSLVASSKFQVLNCQIQLLFVNMDIEHLYYHIKFCWRGLFESDLDYF